MQGRDYEEPLAILWREDRVTTIPQEIIMRDIMKIGNVSPEEWRPDWLIPFLDNEDEDTHFTLQQTQCW